MQTATHVDARRPSVLNRDVTACHPVSAIIAHCARSASSSVALPRGSTGPKPVHGFGAIHARVLVLGLAPAPRPNRTGPPNVHAATAPPISRYPGAHKVGFASASRVAGAGYDHDDGMRSLNAYHHARLRAALRPATSQRRKEMAKHCSNFSTVEDRLVENVVWSLPSGR